MIQNKTQTLCWDCANACGDCSWSRYTERKAVEGWKALERLVTVDGDLIDASYCVMECPEFIRDAEKGGTIRVRRKHEECLH